MKLKYTFEVMELDNESIAVPVGEGAETLHAVLNLNEEAASILKLLQYDTTENEIADKLTKEYDISKDAILPMIHAFVERLKEERLLCE